MQQRRMLIAMQKCAPISPTRHTYVYVYINEHVHKPATDIIIVTILRQYSRQHSRPPSFVINSVAS